MNLKVIKNASWIIVCRIIQSIISFLIGIFTARYLGPSNYGLISYASSLVAFALPIMRLGFSDTLVREITLRPEEEGKVLGTSVTLSILASIASIIGISAFTYVANPNEQETMIVCFLYSLSLIFQAVEMIQYWFQAKLMSKYSSVASLAAYCVVSIYKVCILISGKSVAWFAITHVIEACVVAILLLAVYAKKASQRHSFSLSLGKEMFLRSRHYISSGLMVVIFQQTDRIMLKTMMNESETGFYSAAMTCVGITGFVFSAIIDSARPYVLEGKDQSDDVFEKRLSTLFSIIIFISLLQAIFMGLLASPLIQILFGKDYAPAANVLQIAVWYIAFGYMGSVRNIWILAEEKQKYLPMINFLGASLNVVANLVLIPILGACGAAIASFATQFFANFILCFLLKPIRPVGKTILKSFHPKVLRSLLQQNRKA